MTTRDPATQQAPSPRARRLVRQVLEWGLSLLAVMLVWQLAGWWRAPDLEDTAPSFTLEDLDGDSVTLEDLRGRTVVLNFWADWCMPCRAEIPSFSRFAQNHPDIAVFGVAADGTATSLRESAARMGIDYPVLVADQATLDAYSVSTLPTTVVVGPEGDVRYAHTGIMLGPQIAFAVSR